MGGSIGIARPALHAVDNLAVADDEELGHVPTRRQLRPFVAVIDLQRLRLRETPVPITDGGWIFLARLQHQPMGMCGECRPQYRIGADIFGGILRKVTAGRDQDLRGPKIQRFAGQGIGVRVGTPGREHGRIVARWIDKVRHRRQVCIRILHGVAFGGIELTRLQQCVIGFAHILWARNATCLHCGRNLLKTRRIACVRDIVRHHVGGAQQVDQFTFREPPNDVGIAQRRCEIGFVECLQCCGVTAELQAI